MFKKVHSRQRSAARNQEVTAAAEFNESRPATMSESDTQSVSNRAGSITMSESDNRSINHRAGSVTGSEASGSEYQSERGRGSKRGASSEAASRAKKCFYFHF